MLSPSPPSSSHGGFVGVGRGLQAESLHSLQSTALRSLLSAPEEAWKILIYDVPSRRVVSPLLSVPNLRSCGVTLHLLITDKRSKVTDVPICYLTRPTEENINLIISDLTLYTGPIHLAFTSKLPRPLLESLGRGLHAAGALSRVKTCADWYLDFRTCVGSFDFMMPRSYPSSLGKGTEAELSAFSRSCAGHLLSVFAVMRACPVVVCKPGTCSDMVAGALIEMLRDHPAGAQGGGDRPTAVIVDRTEYPEGGVMFSEVSTRQKT